VNRGVIIALALSLAANVFLGGFVAGRMVGPRFHGPPPALSDDLMAISREALPPQALKELRRTMLAQRDTFREIRRENAGIRLAFIEAISAEEFDRAKADAAAARIAAAEGERRARAAAMLVEVAAKLSPEDRKAFAQALRANHERARHRMLLRREPPPES
jgi:uncharacterized membrane protein